MAERQLYSDGKIRITSSWLIVGRESHAIRYINSLSYDEWHPPRKHALGVAVIAALLSMLAFAQLINKALPFGIAWLLLAACIVLLLVAIHIWKRMPSTYRLSVGFSGGQRLDVPVGSHQQLHAMHDALREALDLHRFDTQPVGQAVAGAPTGATPGESASAN